ncbi:hypothetical protein RHSIM_RhsimUnG0214700 [Rhododendron simsii]|uniref:Uncharacterized protein n=1 Tax=Rhododendron simsii TaxID=118357 RepID=A0A834FVM2_RHOSS|nr:hypothetical protein RHSIM_RhsimUnG0214700 [Rhododendron simsii]
MTMELVHVLPRHLYFFVHLLDRNLSTIFSKKEVDRSNERRQSSQREETVHSLVNNYQNPCFAVQSKILAVIPEQVIVSESIFEQIFGPPEDGACRVGLLSCARTAVPKQERDSVFVTIQGSFFYEAVQASDRYPAPGFSASAMRVIWTSSLLAPAGS